MEGKQQADQGLQSRFPVKSWLDFGCVSQSTIGILLHAENQGRKRIFEILGFVEETADRESTLRPPITDNTPLGKQNRRKLLRAWVEIHAWLVDFKRLYGGLYSPFNISLLMKEKHLISRT